MSDDTIVRSRRIALAWPCQGYEVRYGTERFGVAREELQRAVDEVGNFVSAIEGGRRG